MIWFNLIFGDQPSRVYVAADLKKSTKLNLLERVPVVQIRRIDRHILCLGTFCLMVVSYQEHSRDLSVAVNLATQHGTISFSITPKNEQRIKVF